MFFLQVPPGQLLEICLEQVFPQFALVRLAGAHGRRHHRDLLRAIGGRRINPNSDDKLREIIERKGLFCVLYSARGSHFFVIPNTGEPVDHNRLTQVGRALRELNIQLIPAYSRRRAVVVNVALAPGTDAYHKSCDCVG